MFCTILCHNSNKTLQTSSCSWPWNGYNHEEYTLVCHARPLHYIICEASPQEPNSMWLNILPFRSLINSVFLSHAEMGLKMLKSERGVGLSMSFPELSSVNQLTDPLWKRLGSTDQRKKKKEEKENSKMKGRASSKTCSKVREKWQ